MTPYAASVAAEEPRWTHRVQLFLRRGWPLVVVMTLIGVAIGGFLGAQRAHGYTAEARLFVTLDTAGNGTDINQGAEFVLWQMPSYAELAKSQYVLRPVVERLGVEGGIDALQQNLEVVRPSDTAILEVTVGDPSRDQAVRIANAVADQLRDAIVDASDTGGENIVRLDVEVVDEATADTAVAGDSDARRLAAVFALGGALLSALLLLIASMLDRKIRGVEDMAMLTDVPVLEFRVNGKEATIDSTFKALAVAQQIAADPGPVTWAVVPVGSATDPLPSGKALTSALTQLGSDVVLLDATRLGEPLENRRENPMPSTAEIGLLFRPRQTWEDMPRSSGATSVVTDVAPIMEATTIHAAQLAGLGWDLRRADHAHAVMEDLRARARVVVVVLGPVRTSPYAAGLLPQSDAVVLGARRDSTALAELEQTTTTLRIGGVKLVAGMLER